MHSHAARNIVHSLQLLYNSFVSQASVGLDLQVYSSGDCCTLTAHSLVTDQFLCFPLENCSDCQRRFLHCLICVQVGFGDELRVETAKGKIQAAMMMFLMLKTKTCQEEVSGYCSFSHEHVNI